MKNRVRKMGAGVAAVFALVLVTSQVAYAQSTDPTGGAATTMLNDVKAWITGHGVPLIVGLLVLGAIIATFVKFGKRGAKAA